MKRIFPISLLVMLFNACGDKEKDYVITDMYFLLPYSVTPVKDTITLNDTLNFAMQFSDSVLELNSNQRYKMKNFDWGLYLAIAKISDSTKTIGQQNMQANNFFTYTTTTGSFQNFSSVGAGIRFIYSDNQYKITGKIRPSQRGVYNMSIFPAKRSDNGIPDSVLRLPNTIGGKRQVLQYRFPSEIVNNGANNFYLLKANANLGNLVVDSIWRGTYTFVVK